MPHITKGAWTIEEDLTVLIGYKVFGRKWTDIQNIQGVNRSAVQIRERVDFKLSSNYKSGAWGIKEDQNLLIHYDELM